MVDLSWENDSAQIELIHRIALRQGYGSVLAKGEIGAPRMLYRKRSARAALEKVGLLVCCS